MVGHNALFSNFGSLQMAALFVGDDLFSSGTDGHWSLGPGGRRNLGVTSSGVEGDGHVAPGISTLGF